MRLWHEAMIPYLDRQRLLGQHRECCALRGAGWGKRHSVVNYVFEAPPEKLIAYHKLVMQEMRNRGYNPDPIWETSSYRGKTLGFQEGWINDRKVEKYLDETLTEKIHTIYDEHNLPYLVECVNNLREKGVDYPYEKPQDLQIEND